MKRLEEIKARAEAVYICWMFNGSDGDEIIENADNDVAWLIAEVERLRATNARLREALKFYADRKNWGPSNIAFSFWHDQFLLTGDGFDVADEALKGGQE